MNDGQITDQPKEKRQKDESDDEDDINTKKMLEKTEDEIRAEQDRSHLNEEIDQVIRCCYFFAMPCCFFFFVY